jgi:hypothetical protein
MNCLWFLESSVHRMAGFKSLDSMKFIAVFSLAQSMSTIPRREASVYLAQYGSFSAGVISAETRPGGNKWDYSLNDPLPDFRSRSGHLVGLRDASPRLNLSGPLIRNRLFLGEDSEYLGRCRFL